jgi:hypothetical protein
MMYVTILAVSGLFATVPTSIASEVKNTDPSARNGITQGVSETCAPKTNTAVAKLEAKANAVTIMNQRALEESHSTLVIGVSDNCLKSFVFLYPDEVAVRDSIGTRIVAILMSPGVATVIDAEDPPEKEAIEKMAPNTTIITTGEIRRLINAPRSLR